jgi:hypothetical protein
MDAIDLTKCLGNLAPEQRREVYRTLRAGLGVSETEPMLPLPASELAAWARRFAEILAATLAANPGTAPVGNPAALEPALLDYAKPASDAFLDSQIAMGAGLKQAGLAAVYLHGIVNAAALKAASEAARDTLSPASAAIVQERYAPAMLLRHSIMQEGYHGAPATPG